MKPPLHGHDLLAAKNPEQQPTGVALNRREWKPWNVLVRDLGAHFDLLDEAAESGPQNDRKIRIGVCCGADGLERAGDALREVCLAHRYSVPGRTT